MYKHVTQRSQMETAVVFSLLFSNLFLAAIEKTNDRHGSSFLGCQNLFAFWQTDCVCLKRTKVSSPLLKCMPYLKRWQWNFASTSEATFFYSSEPTHSWYECACRFSIRLENRSKGLVQLVRKDIFRWLQLCFM